MADMEKLEAILSDQLARCEREHSEALAAALLRRDAGAIRAELIEDIREKRRLLAMLDRRPREAAA